MEALDTQRDPIPYIEILRELYKNFTTKTSPFNDDINIDVKRGVRQGDTISPKLFTVTLENVMQRVEWDNIVKTGGRRLHHLRFADSIVLIRRNINQAEQMMADFDNACGKISHLINLPKMMFMRNALAACAPFTLNEINISECSRYVCLCREFKIMNDLGLEPAERQAKQRIRMVWW
ncbi:unnamed protein product [Angiostrongylus costaricensis]|uniref:Reverse transcriptase domain-containing protein n=1 Tax=Angiostrongylus costaricensis TaxID=334426 RepID=A0A0R3PLX7_ANGCS|nr:unnamed protein product [Angiostrongylus costaricensis]